MMKANFGKNSELYTLENKNGMKIAVSDFGATLVKILVADKEGKERDVVLGYDDAEGYDKGDKFFGAIVGRIANRIGGASFELNGKRYDLVKNDNDNNLHSGIDFYNKRVWEVKEAAEDHVTFALNSPHMDQGYPGNFKIEVTYTLTDDNEIKIHYNGTTDQDTIVNMTNHSYFNLNGEDSGSVLSQKVWLDADAFTRANNFSIPTGEILPVEGTPMDFRVEKTLGRDIDNDYEALNFGHGYDHNWVLNGSGYRKVGTLTSDESGIKMEIFTDRPGVQIYTGNFIEDAVGKSGHVYADRSAVCFETQLFPDAVNKEMFESPVLKAGEVYESTTTYRFTRA